MGHQGIIQIVGIQNSNFPIYGPCTDNFLGFGMGLKTDRKSQSAVNVNQSKADKVRPETEKCEGPI